MAILAILAICPFWTPKSSDFHFWHIGPWIRGLHAVLPYGTNTPLFSGLRYTVRYTGTLTPIWDLQMGPRTPKMTHFGPILDPFLDPFGDPLLDPYLAPGADGDHPKGPPPGHPRDPRIPWV